MADEATIPAQMRLYNAQRQRLYINRSERLRLIDLAPALESRWHALLLTLLYTGCRASEVLDVTPNHLQLADGVMSFRTLKKRKFAMREIPIPDHLCALFNRTFLQNGWRSDQPFWPISRKTVWRQVKSMMQQAEIRGAQACPKGLRHGFGIHAIACGIELPKVQEWMGHSDPKVTAIYTKSIGPDERERARLMW